LLAVKEEELKNTEAELIRNQTQAAILQNNFAKYLEQAAQTCQEVAGEFLLPDATETWCIELKRYEEWGGLVRAESLSSFTNVEQLFKGNHSVLKAVYGNESVALKKFEFKQKERVLNEARLLNKLKHCQHVADLKFLFYDESMEHCYLVSPLYAGDLSQYIKKLRVGEHDDDKRASICAQLCRALRDVHAAGIWHCDVKPANVFLESLDVKAEPHVRLGDFDVSLNSEERASKAVITARTTAGHTRCVGTPGFMAPELLRDKPLKSAKADVYSLGCTMFDMYFNAKDRPDASTSDTKAFTVPAHSNPHLRELLQKMLEWDPDKRPSADEVVKHRFVAQAVQQLDSHAKVMEEFSILLKKDMVSLVVVGNEMYHAQSSASL